MLKCCRIRVRGCIRWSRIGRPHMRSSCKFCWESMSCRKGGHFFVANCTIAQISHFPHMYGEYNFEGGDLAPAGVSLVPGPTRLYIQFPCVRKRKMLGPALMLILNYCLQSKLLVSYRCKPVTLDSHKPLPGTHE
jgi:hypothetical protein